ncbi:MAG: hypothetical protein AAFP04_00800 [Myxococcota bacterium]
MTGSITQPSPRANVELVEAPYASASREVESAEIIENGDSYETVTGGESSSVTGVAPAAPQGADKVRPLDGAPATSVNDTSVDDTEDIEPFHISPEAQLVLDDMRVRVDRSGVDAPARISDLPFDSFGLVPSEARLNDVGQVEIDVDMVVRDDRIPMLINIDPESRLMRMTGGNMEPIEVTLPRDVRDLIDFRDGQFVPIGPGVEAVDFRLEEFGPVAAVFDGVEDVDLERDRRYFLAENIGAAGTTLAGQVFVAPDEVAELAARLQVLESDPERYRDAVVANELAHAAWSDMVLASANRSFGPDELAENILQHVRDVNTANYFGDLPTGVPGVRPASNSQANEFVSDAASIGTDPSDLFRVLGHLPDLTYAPNYEFSVRFARHNLDRVLLSRGVDPIALQEFYTDLQAREVSATDMVERLGVTESDLEAVQAAYVDVASRLVNVFDEELRARYPGEE